MGSVSIDMEIQPVLVVVTEWRRMNRSRRHKVGTLENWRLPWQDRDFLFPFSYSRGWFHALPVDHAKLGVMRF